MLCVSWPWGGAAERVFACSRSKALWFFWFFFSTAGVTFLGRPRFLLFNLRPLGSSLALRGLGEGLTMAIKLGRSSSPQESCYRSNGVSWSCAGGESRRSSRGSVTKADGLRPRWVVNTLICSLGFVGVLLLLLLSFVSFCWRRRAASCSSWNKIVTYQCAWKIPL